MSQGLSHLLQQALRKYLFTILLCFSQLDMYNMAGIVALLGYFALCNTRLRYQTYAMTAAILSSLPGAQVCLSHSETVQNFPALGKFRSLRDFRFRNAK